MEVEMRVNNAGSRVWHKKDNFYEYHREDGPAVTRIDGHEYWYLNGYRYHTLQEFPLNLFLAYVKWELKKHGK
jgi:hypothetical protein